MGKVSQKVEAMYRDACMIVDVPEAPDHVAIEFEFLHFLCSQERFKEEQTFLQHFNSWYPQFQNKIEASGVGSFYPALSSLLSNILK